MGASDGKSASDFAVLGAFRGNAALDSTALGELGCQKQHRRRRNAEVSATFGGFKDFESLGILVSPRSPVDSFV